jgi:hypothetical protein
MIPTAICERPFFKLLKLSLATQIVRNTHRRTTLGHATRDKSGQVVLVTAQSGFKL